MQPPPVWTIESAILPKKRDGRDSRMTRGIYRCRVNAVSHMRMDSAVLPNVAVCGGLPQGQVSATRPPPVRTTALLGHSCYPPQNLGIPSSNVNMYVALLATLVCVTHARFFLCR